MKKLRKIIAFLLVACMVTAIVPTATYVSAADADADLWVDPVNGKDTNNGTTAGTALKTITAAKTKAASLSASGDVVVILKGGVYDATTPIVFGSSDSGKNGNTITYRAAAGEEVLISGGEKLTEWTLYDAENNIYVADIPSAARLTRQFYVDGEPQPVAALEQSPTDWEELSNGFSVPEKYNLKDLWYPQHVEMNTLYLWYHRVEHFTGINSSGTEIYEDTDCLPTWVANDYLFIDRAGEWYIDRYEYKIYYKADGTMDGKEAYLPVTEQVIQMDYASNITFEGITFSHTSYTYTSENRYLDQQANGHYYDNAWHQVPAGIEVTGCTGIVFDGCDIINMGTAGIRIKSDSTKVSDGNKIINSRIHDISYSGIIVGEIFAHHGYQSYQLVKNTTIQNNYITRIGIDMFDSPGIVATYTSGTVIDHNEISYCPYSGISLGWGWSDEESNNNTAFMNEVGNNQVTNNYIHDVCKTNYDGGAFYSLGMSKGTVVSGNYVYNSGNGDSRGEISLYLDEGSSYMEICNNVVGGQSSYWLQMYYSNIHDNNWHDNYYDASIPSRNNGENNTLVNNTAVANGDFSKYPAAVQIIENAGLLDESLKDGIYDGFIHQHDIVQSFWPGSTDRYIEPTWGWENVSVDGQVGRTVYDSVNGTVSIIVDGDVDITALPLNFTLLSGWTSDKAPGSVQDFTNPVTYTLRSGSYTVRWVVTVNQQVSSDEEIVGEKVDLSGAFASESDWTSAPSSVSGGVMTHSGYSVYIGEKFSQDSIFEFDLSIPLTSTGEWVAFTIKTQKPGTMCINGGTEYYIGFNTDDVEVQKFVNGQRTVIFGQVDGFTPTYGVLPNNFFTPGSFHSIRCGAINVSGGVRFFLFVDGNLVFDITDFSNPITADGYFGVYGMTKSISLRAFTNIQNTPDRTALDAAIAEAESVKATDYSAESYRNLQSALAEADEMLSAYGGVTQAMVDEAYAVITAALDALEEENSGATPTEPTTAPTQPTTAPTQPTTAPSEPATAPAVPATGTWLDLIPESSITPHVGYYNVGDLETLTDMDTGEEEYLTDAHVGIASWIKGSASINYSRRIPAAVLDLNGTKAVGAVELVARDGDYITKFDIQVKDTNGIWQTVKSVTSSPFEDSYTVRYTFEPVVGTEVRVLIYDHLGTSADYPMLMEISVFELKTGTQLVKIPVANVEANKSAYVYQYTVDKVIDGDRSNFFTVGNGNLPVKVEFDLTQEDGNPSNICRMVLYAYHSIRYTTKGIVVEVQTEKDGAWTHIYTGNAYTNGFTDTFVLDFDQAYDAYALRLTVNSTIDDYLILNEVELFGYEFGEVEEPEEDIQLSAPTGLIATQITDSSITVTADEIEGGTLMYRIDGGQWQSSGVFTGLNRYTKYTIEAMYAGNTGYLDSEVSSITERTAKTQLNAPTGLAVTEITDNSVTVTADAVTGGNLRYRTNGGAWQSSGTITGLTPNTVYTIEVMYVGSTGYADSAVATIEATTAKTQLSAPTGLKVVATDTVISASANTVEGGTLMFRIDGGQWQSSGMFTGLNRNTEYTIEAMYVGDEGYVDSDVTSVVTRTGKTYLNAPTGLTVSTSYSTITVTADEVEGGTLMFRINGGAWQTSGEFTGLDSDTTYTVEAMYIGEADYVDSDIASTSVTTLALTILEAPVIEVVFTDDSTIVVEAAAVEGGMLMFRIDGGQWQTSGEFTGLDRDTTYIVEAMYVGSEGYGDSDVTFVEVTTDMSLLPVPELQVVATDSTVTVTADAVEGGILMFRIDGGAWQTSGEFTGLTDNTTYTVEAMYVGAEGYIDSDVTTITVTTEEKVVEPEEPSEPTEPTEPVEDPEYLTYKIVDGEAIITRCDRTYGGRMTIPDTLGGYPVTSIDYGAFRWCHDLTGVTIPDSVTSIGGGAFYWCTSLTNITIPDSVTSIGSSAFYNCYSLSNVYYGGTEEQWDQIYIGDDNSYLMNANIHFTEPEEPVIVETNALAGASFSVRLIEPWAMRVTVTYYKGQQPNHVKLNLADLTSYGAYAILGSKFEAAENATLEDLLNDADTIHFEMSDVAAEGKIYPINATQAMFDFYDGLYTYRLNEAVYLVTYYEDAEGLHFSRVRSKTLVETIDGLKNLSEKESNVYTSMKAMEASVTAYRATLPSSALGTVYPAGLSITDSGIAFGADPAPGTYKFGTSVSIKLIEPWGLKADVRIVDSSNATIDYTTADDYGVIFFHDKDGKYTESGMTADDILAEAGAQVYANSLGNATLANSRMTAIYDQGIFTYEMDSNVYAMPFVVMNGEYYYRSNGAFCYNLIGRIEKFAGETTRSAEEIAVYNAMISMNENILIYRGN